MKNKVLLCFAGILLFSKCQPDTYRQGRVLYQVHCENCHMEDGKGLFDLIPSLVNSDFITKKPLDAVCLIRKGLPMNLETRQQMPANTTLNDVEITNLINYLRSLSASGSEAVRVADVREALGQCP